MRLDSEYFARLQRYVPAALQDPAIRLLYTVRSPLYGGGAVSCVCCGGSFARFLPPSDECPGCGSQARQRLLLSYLRARTDLFSRTTRLLHLAPELCLQRVLRDADSIDYLSADLELPRAQEKMDITDIHHRDESFDAILCSHVLEHVPDDARAMAELYRVLAVDGWAILQVPLDASRASTYEDSSITDPAQRAQHFGRFDHCRVYGLDYKARLERAGFDVRVDDYVATFSPPDQTRNGFDPQEKIYVCRKVCRG